MLLTGYTKEMFRPKCNHNFQSVHCLARLAEDIGEVLPYLNAALDGSGFVKAPPSVTLRFHGKLITVHAREIFVNALRDEQEADSVLEWLKKEINETWQKRAEIEPKYDTDPKPRMLEILKLLPKNNCEKCGEPTCMVFAVRAAEGIKTPDDCPEISEAHKIRLGEYLSGFKFD
jgi:ArsR family metal-binding transcriptional regulator